MNPLHCHFQGDHAFDVPLNPKIGDTWSRKPLALYRQILLLAAECLLHLAADGWTADSIRRHRLRHREIYRFSGVDWRAKASWGDSWNYISADGRTVGTASCEAYLAPLQSPDDSAPALARLLERRR